MIAHNPGEVAGYEDLSPYFADFQQALNDAQDEFNEELSVKLRAGIRPRSQSSIVNDLVRNHLFRVLGKHRGHVWFQERYGQTLLWIQGTHSTYRIKFKKLDQKKRPSFTKTQLALDFVYEIDVPNSQLYFEGFGVTNAFLGYTHNSLRTAIEDVILLHPFGLNRFDWELRITKMQPPAAVTDLPAPQAPPAKPPKRVRPVRQKKPTKGWNREQ